VLLSCGRSQNEIETYIVTIVIFYEIAPFEPDLILASSVEFLLRPIRWEQTLVYHLSIDIKEPALGVFTPIEEYIHHPFVDIEAIDVFHIVSLRAYNLFH
jgi:hypothetical protein